MQASTPLDRPSLQSSPSGDDPHGRASAGGVLSGFTTNAICESFGVGSNEVGEDDSVVAKGARLLVEPAAGDQP